MLSILLLSLLMVNCQSDQDKTETSEDLTPEETASFSAEENEIITTVENILRAAGNYNMEELANLSTDKTVIGYTWLKDGLWNNSELTLKEYIENNRKRELTPFIELVSDYDILITEGRMAVVRAAAVVNRFGNPGKKEVNHLILIKEDSQWKLLSIGWTAQEQPEQKKAFDLNIFAQGYAQVWGSGRPEFVAMFFEEDGSLQVNNGEPALGRAAIADVAQSFMTQFPDMNVRFDSLAHNSDGVAFHWTLTGTDADPEGKGHKVKISGYEVWTLSEANLIKASKGHFSTEEYNRQLEFGIDQ